jgi:hypothetical protein
LPALVPPDRSHPRAKENSRSIRLFEFALFLALLYGINLYFSTNANINDPIVPGWWPATKDAISFLVFGLLLFGLREHFPKSSSLPLALVVTFSVTSAVLSLWFFGFTYAAMSFSKNIVLYFAGGAVIGIVLAGACPAPEIALRISRPVVLSVLIGFACLLLPVQSTDGRFYGTYGNPTSLGYAVFLAFALSVAFRSVSESVFFAALLGLTFIVTGSFSVLLAAGVFLVVYSTLEIIGKRTVNLQVVHLLVIVVSTAFFGTLLNYFHGLDFGYRRLAELPDSILDSDSVTVRVKAFVLPIEVTYKRYDGFLLGLYKNFGWAPLLVYFGLIASLVLAYFRSGQTRTQNAVAACVMCIFVVNPLLQHQIELFPTNFLFGSFLGCAIYWLNQVQDQESVPSSLPGNVASGS